MQHHPKSITCLTDDQKKKDCQNTTPSPPVMTINVIKTDCTTRAMATTATATSTSCSTSLSTTRDIQREQEKMLRGKHVKERLGPIVDRLKASLSKIESLENTMAVSSSCDNNVADGKQQNEQQQQQQYSYSSSSRDLMHSSMEMVKRKLLRLKEMEEILEKSEDRRHTLQHQILQVSLCNNNNNNNKYINKTDTESITTTTRLKQENAELKQRFHELEQQQEQQKDIISNEQIVKCEELECQVDHLKTLCENLMGNLKQQEERNEFLEQELVETRKFVRLLQEQTVISPRRPVKTIQLQKGGSAKECSSTITDLSFFDSTVGEDEDNSSCDNNSSSSSNTTTEDDNSSHLTGMATEASLGLQNNNQKANPEATTAMLHVLMKKIEALDRENAELREGKRHAIKKYNSLHHEMMKQGEVIQQMHQQLYSRTTSPMNEHHDVIVAEQTLNNGEETAGVAIKGRFFQKFLSAPGKQ